MHGLPREYDGPVQRWDTAVAMLDAIVRSEMPVVVEVGEDSYMQARTYASFRGLLRRTELATRSEREERFVVVPYTTCSAPGRGTYHEPRTKSDGGLITLAGERFVMGRLTTYDGDDYFFLTLWMGGTVVLLMDTNSH
jgi:hypothetical protein